MAQTTPNPVAENADIRFRNLHFEWFGVVPCFERGPGVEGEYCDECAKYLQIGEYGRGKVE